VAEQFHGATSRTAALYSTGRRTPGGRRRASIVTYRRANSMVTPTLPPLPFTAFRLSHLYHHLDARMHTFSISPLPAALHRVSYDIPLANGHSAPFAPHRAAAWRHTFRYLVPRLNIFCYFLPVSCSAICLASAYNRSSLSPFNLRVYIPLYFFLIHLCLTFARVSSAIASQNIFCSSRCAALPFAAAFWRMGFA